MGGEARHPLDTPLAELDSTRDAALAAPAPSPTPPPSLSETAADGAGTPPAGVSAGAEASQQKRHSASPTNRGGQRKLSDDDCRRLCRQYIEDRHANGGRKVEGWVKRKAAEYGVSEPTMYNALHPAMAAVMTDKMIGKEERRTERALKTPEPRVRRMIGTRY